MRFQKLEGFILMRAGKTQNMLEITEDMIKESISKNVFDNAPIVFNNNGIFIDYRNNDDVEEFIREQVIGVVLPDTVSFNGFDVIADVMIHEEFADRTHFDNWCIQFDEDKQYFFYNSCEVFSKKDTPFMSFDRVDTAIKEN